MANDELRKEALDKVKAFNDTELDNKIKYRGIDHKRPAKVNQLVAFYEKRIPEIKEQLLEIAIAKQAPELFPHIHISHEGILIEKRDRLLDKLACCLKEQDLRKDNKVSRVYHDTDYYIDLDGGNDGNTGLNTGQAWLTMAQFCNVTARTAGDRAFVRANTDEPVAATITVDEDGDEDDLIEVIGCDSVTNDPWADGSDVLPVLDFQSAARQSYQDESYWRWYRMEFTDSTDSLINTYRIWHGIIDSCVIHNTTVEGLQDETWGRLYIYDTDFYDNTSWSIAFGSAAIAYVSGCTFNCGAGVGTNYACQVESGGTYYITDCTFGSTTQHNTATIRLYEGENHVYLRNCKFDDATLISDANRGYSYVFSEDHDQTYGDHYSWCRSGVIEKDAAVQLDGEDSAKMQPDSDCGVNHPLILNHDMLKGAYRVWLPAALATVTITARETVAWASDPSASEFYFVASYLNHAANATRSEVQSAQGLNGINEVDFTMTFTPLQAGWVYIQCYLGEYEAGKYVNVSVVPQVS